MADSVYLDHNATTPVRPEAAEAVVHAMGTVGNPSSVHRYGRAARRLVEDARESVAALAGARAPQVVFTSGGTEANNLALRGTGRHRILVSAGEHPSVLQAAPSVRCVPLQRDGRVDLTALAAMLAEDCRPALVSVMLANNETGVLQPVDKVVTLARDFGARVHCDAVQAAGKIPFDMASLGVDMLTLSAHKIGGPQGAGALVVADDLPVEALVRGGGQERGQRAGTESVPAIAGFGAAAEAAVRTRGMMRTLEVWRDRLEDEVRALAPETAIHGKDAPRLPNTSCIGWTGMPAETQVMALDLARVAVSSGSACSSGKVHASHVLTAMGETAEAAGAAIRVSLGWNSAEGDVDRFLTVWRGLVANRRAGDLRSPAA